MAQQVVKVGNTGEKKQTGTYTIKPGDTLWDIAQVLGTTINQIASLNNIADVDKITAGDIIQVPTAPSVSEVPTIAKPSSVTNAAANDTGFSYEDFKYDKTFSYDDFSYGDYEESETVKAAKAALEAQLAKKPGEYQSQWQAQLDDTINKILNREKFSYDFNGDALYQQYKDKYIQQGKMAMADTMGQAAAMTGGYGNSYAATVGNQAYQQSLQQLNDIVPELYQMAYDRYNQEGQDLYNQYAMLGDRENTDYGRYRDTVADWMTERDYLTGRYDSERDYDYSKYTDDRNFKYNQYADDRNFQYGQFVDDRNFAYDQYADDKSYAYNEYRNSIADAQWKAEFEEAKRQFDAKNTTSSGGGGNGGGNGNTTETGKTEEEAPAPVEEKVTYSSIVQDLNDFIKSGATKSKISAYIRSAKNAGYITASQAQKLLQTYTPRGYTY